ncbi:ABC transporter permease subunit, partial [Paraburkholderia sp. SIMBA_049]
VIVTMRVSPHWLPNRFARAYILVCRGSPLLIQMFLVYYGLGQFGVIRESFVWPLLREPYVCAVLSLALCTAGYTAEILRGGLMAVPVGQIEAAHAYGMSPWQTLTRVRLPIAARLALSGVGNVWLNATKDASFISVLGSFTDLLKASQLAAGATRHYVFFYLVTAALFLV